jgi:hypothetical protein
LSGVSLVVLLVELDVLVLEEELDVELELLTELSKEGKVVPQLTTSNVNKGVINVFFI